MTTDRRRWPAALELELPVPPRGRLSEFAPRYAAAQQMARRYVAAVATVAGHRDERDRLAAGWPVIRRLLERIGRHCVQGARASGRSGTGRRHASRGRTERQRHLHDVHLGLVGLEQAVDRAVVVAVGVLLDVDETDLLHHRAELDGWLVALGGILNELDG